MEENRTVALKITISPLNLELDKLKDLLTSIAKIYGDTVMVKASPAGEEIIVDPRGRISRPHKNGSENLFDDIISGKAKFVEAKPVPLIQLEHPHGEQSHLDNILDLRNVIHRVKDEFCFQEHAKK